jgi:predicted small secreted protein
MVTRLILLTLLLAGCTTARGSFCDIAHPWRLSQAAIDAMTDAEVAAALAHNRKGEVLCRWKP